MKRPRASAPTVRALLDSAIARFDAAGLSYGHGTANALDEAAWLVLHALRLPVDELAAHLERRVDAPGRARIEALLERRMRTRKPAAYLLNEAWLGPHRFYVDERAIVPRSFIAELLRNWGQVQFAPTSRQQQHGLRNLAPIRASERSELNLAPIPSRILDLCTGSGCLAILAALAYPGATVDAADISRDALAVARRNVREYRLEGRVRLVRSDLFTALGPSTYDLIVSNPPYVKASSMRKLPAEYRHEPVLALASGADGLEHTRAILAAARGRLAEGGSLVVEIGHNRKALEKAFPKLAFRWPKTSAGRGHVFTLRREDLPR